MGTGRRLGALGLACGAALALAAGEARAANRCEAKKLDAVAKAAACLAKNEARGAERGTPADAERAARCLEAQAAAFARAEAKPQCSTAGDAGALAGELSDFGDALETALAVGLPSRCQAAKLRAAGAAARCLLRHAAKEAKSDRAADPAKLAACRDRLADAFAKAERKTCGSTGDAAAVQALVDGFVGAASDRLAGSGPGSLDRWVHVPVTEAHALTFGLDFGDLDGDGDLDLVSGLHWYANPGGDLTGTWVQSAALPNGIHAMLVADVDGDALADVIGQKDYGAEVYWLEATDAAASGWTEIPVGTLPPASHDLGMQGARVAEIHGGGRPEILLSSGGGIFAFTIPAASPEAGSWPVVRIHQNPSDEGFGVGDVDGDGDLDVAAGTGAAKTVEWYRNPGTGGADWEAFPLGDVSDFSYPDRFEVADLNGDGRPDVIGTEENGVGDGAKTVWWAQPADPTSPGWTRTLVATQGTTNSLDAADLDDDGDVDLVTGEHRGDLAVRVFENDGSGAFAPHLVDEGKESHEGTQLADLDGDGDLDLASIAFDAYGDVHVWRNDAGADVPFERVVLDDDLPGFLDCKSVGDLDGDGLPDVLIGTDTQLVWYKAPGWERAQIVPGGNFTTDMQVADVDADGDLDVVVPEYDGQVVEWIRNPLVGGGSWTKVPIGSGVTAHDLEVADVDQDGKLDVVIRGHFGPTTLYLQQDPSTWTAVGIPAAVDNEGLALADLDGDGDVDIVQNGYWLEAPDDPSDGSAWVKHGFDASWEASTVGVTVADLSEDGRPDVILAFGESPGPMVWYEAPEDPTDGGAWIPHPITDTADYVHTFKTGDVDGDGNLDVVFAEMAQSDQKRVGIFRNHGGGQAWTLQVLSTDGSHNVRVADIGADGDLDVVGANWQDGSQVELFENRLVP